jgi:hypothetical protein
MGVAAGRDHFRSGDFPAVIQDTLDQLSGKHKDRLATRKTLDFQVFDPLSLLTE